MKLVKKIIASFVIMIVIIVGLLYVIGLYADKNVKPLENTMPKQINSLQLPTTK